MIEIKNAHVIFNKGSKIENHALKGIDLQITDGEFVTIIGGNGAGKSTLMNILSGDIMLSSGQIFIDGLDVTKMKTSRRAGMISRVFQDPMIGTFADLTIEENMSLALKRGQRRGIKFALMENVRKEFRELLADIDIGLENRLGDKVALLSGGQRQALSLIMSALTSSKILLLDEHTAALDPKIARKILHLTNKIIRQHKLTALMITHSMLQALNYGSRTVMMYHGKIVRDMQGENRKRLSTEDLIKYFDL